MQAAYLPRSHVPPLDLHMPPLHLRLVPLPAPPPPPLLAALLLLLLLLVLMLLLLLLMLLLLLLLLAALLLLLLLQKFKPPFGLLPTFRPCSSLCRAAAAPVENTGWSLLFEYPRVTLHFPFLKSTPINGELLPVPATFGRSSLNGSCAP